MYLSNFFVFGNSLPGLKNYERFLAAHQPQTFKAKAKGQMYYLPEDGYPVVLDGEGEIQGVVYVSREMPMIIPQFDEIHKFTGFNSQAFLIREIRDVQLVETGETLKAHIYVWPHAKAEWLKENGVLIPDGDWLKFLQEQKDL